MKTIKMKEVKPIPMFLCLQLFVYGNMIFPCGSIEITSEGIVNGIWTLIDHSSVTLVCTIPPGTGLLIWRFNSSKVAECSVQSCRQISTDDGAFSFGFDTENGIYKWSISPVKIQEHNGQVFECNDGTNAKNVTAVVTASVMTQNDTEKGSSHYSISQAGMILAAIDVFADLCVLVVVCVLGYKILWNIPNGNENEESMNMKTCYDDLKHVRRTVDDMKQQHESNKTTTTTMDDLLTQILKAVCENREKFVKIDDNYQQIKKTVEEIQQFQIRIENDMKTLKSKIETISQDLHVPGKIVVEPASVPTEIEGNISELKEENQPRNENGKESKEITKDVLKENKESSPEEK